MLLNYPYYADLKKLLPEANPNRNSSYYNVLHCHQCLNVLLARRLKYPTHDLLLVDDRHTDDSIESLDDLGSHWKRQIEHHFGHYKDLKKPGSTKVWGWGDIDNAKRVIAESIERYKGQ